MDSGVGLIVLCLRYFNQSENALAHVNQTTRRDIDLVLEILAALSKMILEMRGALLSARSSRDYTLQLDPHVKVGRGALGKVFVA